MLVPIPARHPCVGENEKSTTILSPLLLVSRGFFIARLKSGRAELLLRPNLLDNERSDVSVVTASIAALVVTMEHAAAFPFLFE